MARSGVKFLYISKKKSAKEPDDSFSIFFLLQVFLTEKTFYIWVVKDIRINK